MEKLFLMNNFAILIIWYCIFYIYYCN